MSTATATAVEAVVPIKKGKKKLIIIIAAVAALVLAGGGGAAFFMLKKKPAVTQGAEGDGEGGGEVQAEADAEKDSHAKAAAKRDPKVLPIFVPLDPFTVNLADRDADRYAQVGITLEIDNQKTADRIKAFMPAVRNNILMTIADRTAVELLGRNGKKALADKVRRETARAIGMEAEDAETPADKAAAKKEAGSGEPETELPVRAVHFSNFIVQ